MDGIVLVAAIGVIAAVGLLPLWLMVAYYVHKARQRERKAWFTAVSDMRQGDRAALSGLAERVKARMEGRH
jgi:hypothetical protein